MNKKILNFLSNLDIVIAGTTVVFLVFLTVIGAARRYIFKSPIIWMEEVQLICFVWVVFLSAGAAFRSGSHVAIEILVDFFPEKIKKGFEALAIIITFIVLAYLMFHSCQYVLQLIQMGKKTTVLGLPAAYIYGTLPLSCLLMIVSLICVTIKSITAEKSKEEKL